MPLPEFLNVLGLALRESKKRQLEERKLAMEEDNARSESEYRKMMAEKMRREIADEMDPVNIGSDPAGQGILPTPAEIGGHLPAKPAGPVPMPSPSLANIPSPTAPKKDILPTPAVPGTAPKMPEMPGVLTTAPSQTKTYQNFNEYLGSYGPNLTRKVIRELAGKYADLQKEQFSQDQQNYRWGTTSANTIHQGEISRLNNRDTNAQSNTNNIRTNDTSRDNNIRSNNTSRANAGLASATAIRNTDVRIGAENDPWNIAKKAIGGAAQNVLGEGGKRIMSAFGLTSPTEDRAVKAEADREAKDAEAKGAKGFSNALSPLFNKLGQLQDIYNKGTNAEEIMLAGEEMKKVRGTIEALKTVGADPNLQPIIGAAMSVTSTPEESAAAAEEVVRVLEERGFDPKQIQTLTQHMAAVNPVLKKVWGGQ